MALGLERELKGKDSGIRTHAIVALSSAVITTSALSLYSEVQARGGNADPLRVIQGPAQAIGFIAAGTIFVATGDPRRSVGNLTTAAIIWLAAFAGIVAGAAQFTLLAAAMGFGLANLVVITRPRRIGLIHEGADE